MPAEQFLCYLMIEIPPIQRSSSYKGLLCEPVIKNRLFLFSYVPKGCQVILIKGPGKESCMQSQSAFDVLLPWYPAEKVVYYIFRRINGFLRPGCQQTQVEG